MSSPKKNVAANNSPDQSKGSAPKGQKKGLTYIFSIVVLVIIMITFIFTGNNFVNGNSQGLEGAVFGTYAGKDISYSSGSYFQRQFTNIYNQYKSSSSDEEQVRLGSLKAAYDKTVLQTALLVEADNAGYQASDEGVADVMKSYFTDDKGEFDKARYKEFKKSQPLEVKNMERLVKDDIIANRVSSAFGTASRLGTKETAFLTSMGAWERSFKYVTFSFSDYPDSEVAAYMTTNGAKFRYRDFSMITVEKKETLEKVRQDILAGTQAFDTYAKEHSLDAWASQNGRRPALPQHELALSLVEADKTDSIMTLKTGDLSEIVAVPAGFAIFKAETDLKDADPANADQIKNAKAYLVKFESGTIQSYIENQAKTFAAEATGKGLEVAAKAAGKTVDTTASFPINYGALDLPTAYGNFPVLARVTGPDSKPIADAQTRPEFFIQAFKLKANEISAPVLLSDRILIMKLDVEKQVTDGNMFATYVPMIFSSFMNADIGELFIQKDKFKDKFLTTYRTYFKQ